MENTPPGMGVARFCKEFDISQSTFWKYVALGSIHTVQIGKKRLVPGFEIARIMREGIAAAPNAPVKRNASAA